MGIKPSKSKIKSHFKANKSSFPAKTMELKVENPMWRKPENFVGESYSSVRVYAEADGEEAESTSTGSYGVCGRSRSFQTVEMDGVPFSGRAEERLAWLRSQIIGGEAEFDSPFGKRRMCYADHTASGRSLRYIEDFILRNVLPFYGNTHTCDSYVGHHTTKMVNDATTYIKRCLGGGEEALIFCGQGTTSAIKRLQEVMGIAVPSILRERVIETLKEEERWVVFVGPYEHHSNLLSWRQSLAEVVEIGMDENGLLDIGMLKSQLEAYKKTGNRPILGSFSACSNVTGIYSDTKAIATLIHQYGGHVCFDFAASGPYVQIDMQSGEIDGYDAIFLSTHKFLGGPGSPGILLMNKSLYKLKSSPPSTCGGGTVSYVNGFSEKDTLYNEEIEERENGGTPQIIGIIRAALAFWVKEYISYQEIEKQEHQYIERALKRLLPNRSICILGSTSSKRQAILSFIIYSSTNSSPNCTTDKLCKPKSREKVEKLYLWEETGCMRAKPLHGPFVAALLSDLFGIQSRGGCSCAGPYGHKLLDIDETCSHAYRSAIAKGYAGIKPGWTRVSFPYYMPNEEFEFILKALEFIADYGQRFLPLYAFNLRIGSWTLKKNELADLLGKENYSDGHIFAFKNQFTNAEAKLAAIVYKHKSYLESAKKIANLLPKFPPERKLHEDIESSLLYFRI
ncbi:probable cysteine desulfurase [Benincasa hispida]|uniref:probable cysteine desulfurase n=1 Tax=Benincasa hispida TaxID=102211 RepID=UPI0019005AFF|nr:probable cysteine desulfurase [Benincasa hispida]